MLVRMAELVIHISTCVLAVFVNLDNYIDKYCRNFTDISEIVILNANCSVLIQILLEFVPKGSNDNNQTLVQEMLANRP